MKTRFLFLVVALSAVLLIAAKPAHSQVKTGPDPVCFSHTDPTLQTPVDVLGVSSEFVVAKVYHKKTTRKDVPINFLWYEGVRLLDEHSHPNSPVYSNVWEVKADDLYVEDHSTVDYSNVWVDVCYDVRPASRIEVDHIEFEIWEVPYPF